MITSRLRAAALALVAATGLASAVKAQDRPADVPPFEEKVNVNEVLLDVLVTDAKGNVIVGLDKNDFVVKEDGRPVDITGVTFYSNRKLVENGGAVKAKAVSVDKVPEDRYFILFVEDQKDAATDAPVLLTQQMEAARRAREWTRKLLPNDWVAVVSYDYKLKVQQDFTHDRQAVAEAIGDAMQGRDREGNWPSRVAATGEGPSIYAGLPKGDELRDKTGTIYDAIRLVAKSTGRITGRKNLLLLTRGFGRINSFGQYTPDLRYYPDMMHALNQNNVAVYPIDLVPSGTEHPFSNGMNQLADDTGGRYFFNFTNFITPFEQVAQENSGYYLLSYRLERPAGKSGYQPVQVKTTNPEFKVRARRGYEYGS